MTIILQGKCQKIWTSVEKIGKKNSTKWDFSEQTTKKITSWQLNHHTYFTKCVIKFCHLPFVQTWIHWDLSRIFQIFYTEFMYQMKAGFFSWIYWWICLWTVDTENERKIGKLTVCIGCHIFLGGRLFRMAYYRGSPPYAHFGT
jgi:hypothetical protein